MFGGNKIKLEKELFDRVKEVTEVAGYSSVEEFVSHVLEKEIAQINPGGAADPEEMREKLRGLGYIS
jgi:Zn-dependent oligopeptidase